MDGAAEREAGLWERLEKLAELMKSGNRRAPPVKRAYIPKAEKRPIGIPAHEGKILQRAAAMTLEPMLEKEFYDFSYGFRDGKPARQAFGRIWTEAAGMGIGKYFGTIDRGLLRGMLWRRRGNEGYRETA